jgi:Heavy metal binding domain
MLKKILFLIFIATIISGLHAQTPRPTPPVSEYTCVMHPEIVQDHPGKCAKCGMELVPLKKEEQRPINAQRSRTKVGAVHRTARTEDHAHPGNWDQSLLPDAQHHHGHEDHAMHEMKMQSSVNVTDPMTREGSGTSWLPDSSPMYGRMFMFGDNMVMLHGAIFPRYTNVSTPRGDDRIDAPNWLMGMFSHPFGDSAQLGLRLMMSLDPLTEGGRGYPLLFQSGETWHDQPLHDRQHPHDLFSELSVSYSQKFTDDFSSYIYFGYPGEPALGPPTFMHRISAMDDPDAPIGHHWQDSSHVTFGVATAGLVWRTIKIEGSVFTGREPDENRYDFDQPHFDSASGRISWNPTPDLALQVSHGYLKSPEASEPTAKRHRTTASIIYNKALGHDTNWATTFVWGQNNDTHEGTTQSFLLESDYQRGRDTFYTRLERVEKSGHELVLGPSDQQKIFPIFAASFGYVHDFTHGDGIDVGLGAQFTIDDRPDDLSRYYGDDLGYGFEVFLRIRPSLHTHHHEVDDAMK